MKKKHVKFLKRIVETPSPTGSEVAVADIVRERLAPIADEIHTDTMGSVHVTYEGRLHLASNIQDAFDGADEGLDAPAFEGLLGDDAEDAGFHDPYFDDDADADDAEPAASYEEQRAVFDAMEPPLTLMLAAHMDEIGLMVTYISPDGFLSIAALGGVDAAILPGMRVDVHAEGGTLRGVVGRKPIHLIDADERKNVTPLDKLVIDLGMPAKKVKKKVKVGDSITIAAGFELFGTGMATSRAFDDKVGVFIACRVMERLANKRDYAGNFVAAITVQEEIGTRGAITSANAVMPDVALAFDVTHATDYPGIDKTKHGEIVCGGGPVIARGPNINPVVFERLVKAAEDEGIPYQLEAEPSVTGTDARAIQVTREGIPTGLVSVPLRYMHTPTEVVSLDDVEATVRLIARFAADLDEAADFVPGHAEDYESQLRLEHGKYSEDYDWLFDEVVRLTEEVSDLQVLAGVDSQDASAWVVPDAFEPAGFAEVEEVISPKDAPFGRQQNALSAEFASFDMEAGAQAFAGVQGKPFDAGMQNEPNIGYDAWQGGAEDDRFDAAHAEEDASEGEDGLEEDDFPAAYANGDATGAPAVNIRFEGELPEDVERAAEEARAAELRRQQEAQARAEAARRSSPVVMVNTFGPEDDE